MSITAFLYKTGPRSKKKYKVVIQYKNDSQTTIQFGAKGYSDYTIHQDSARRQRYLQRHSKDPKNDLQTAGTWARDLLWSKPSINQAISYMEKKYDMNIIKK